MSDSSYDPFDLPEHRPVHPARPAQPPADPFGMPQQARYPQQPAAPVNLPRAQAVPMAPQVAAPQPAVPPGQNPYLDQVADTFRLAEEQKQQKVKREREEAARRAAEMRAQEKAARQAQDAGGGVSGFVLWIGALAVINFLSFVFDWPFWVY